MSEMLHTFSSIFRDEKITLAKFMRAKIARIRTEAEQKAQESKTEIEVLILGVKSVDALN